MLNPTKKHIIIHCHNLVSIFSLNQKWELHDREGKQYLNHSDKVSNSQVKAEKHSYKLKSATNRKGQQQTVIDSNSKLQTTFVNPEYVYQMSDRNSIFFFLFSVFIFFYFFEICFSLPPFRGCVYLFVCVCLSDK